MNPFSRQFKNKPGVAWGRAVTLEQHSAWLFWTVPKTADRLLGKFTTLGMFVSLESSPTSAGLLAWAAWLRP